MKTLRIIRSQFSQRGHGLGSVFKSLFRVFMPVAKTVFRASKPILKEAARETGKELIRTGVDTVGDIISGENIKNSVKKNAKAGVKRMGTKIQDKFQNGGSNIDPIKRVSKKKNSQSRSGVSKSKKQKTIFD